jgi:hypothetical protein
MPLDERSMPFQIMLRKEDMWKRYRTISYIAVLEGDALQRTQKAFDEALNVVDVQVDEQGRIAVHGQTVSVWTTRIQGSPSRNSG